MRLLVFGQVDHDHIALTAIQRIRQGNSGFGLSDTRGADQQEDPLGFVRVFQIGP
ncbi:hypothetical protein D3C84_1309370 [compost metagenome]